MSDNLATVTDHCSQACDALTVWDGDRCTCCSGIWGGDGSGTCLGQHLATP